MNHIFAYIPSPPQGVWHIGLVPVRAYALLILLGITVAVFVGNKRWIERGGLAGQVSDIAMWAVPFGVIGGRLYHVMTDWSTYFGTGGRGFTASLMIWEGGLGIWGAIALGAVGARIGCKRHNVSLPPFADAIAPGIAFAQAIGRWGNYANQELFGKPTTLPWGLKISIEHRPTGYIQFDTFHPTFLYESIACAIIGFVVIWADRKFHMGHGRVFALYLSLYCAARGGIETMRIDEAHHILGIRLNVFTAVIVGLGALAYMVRSAERHPGRESLVDGRVVAQGELSDVSEQERQSDAHEVEPDSQSETVIVAEVNENSSVADVDVNDSGDDDIHEESIQEATSDDAHDIVNEPTETAEEVVEEAEVTELMDSVTEIDDDVDNVEHDVEVDVAEENEEVTDDSSVENEADSTVDVDVDVEQVMPVAATPVQTESKPRGRRAKPKEKRFGRK